VKAAINGNFPMGWAEWNDKYRDSIRAYWKGDGGLLGELAQRLTDPVTCMNAAGANRMPASISSVRTTVYLA